MQSWVFPPSFPTGNKPPFNLIFSLLKEESQNLKITKKNSGIIVESIKAHFLVKGGLIFAGIGAFYV